ncbi:MAG: hypothetical protein COS82_09310 [Zetaproteobacteria bacterium CG06_land_8_20_14_3_00_59_53]|nr:MAG: hypothetical protein AUK36_09815 [Zetaproteobacteria bacterium CG2_30_59_37]PIO90741.1 MAG: hypothetical protein COX56_00980 [Zetaproteobacteria bacterium CG23_combo_of_CG06-09_8_20_14_all_59_86]PIQ65313.1 MAG: hypothetical protein COV97_04580 [Zetaproteobacteria bacterium CG11_big_fil_rev_8_21_14_0_20_59_439]PIU69855.1 MAG: hypothetical protein COS82_09310 [Zetaproteobacteria bacterium CG06_land_8_20_14_3_00_59_53]PIU97381.1 MAG: hypothetical protein COS62_04020 [Zetaproteobacteria bac
MNKCQNSGRNLFAVAMLILLGATQADASECGLSCCIAAGVEGVGNSTGFSLTAQYELMDMKTIRQGSTKLSPQQARTITGTNLSVPTKMTMQKFSTNISYRVDEDQAVVLTIPYLINDMEMLSAMGMNMTMDTISGLGDVSMVYLRNVYTDTPIRTRKRFSLGAGIIAPTGKHDHRNRSGQLIHMMMQTGTGAWGGVLIANGTLAFGEHEDRGAQWLISPSLTYQTNTTNNLGYRVGDRLNADISARYRLTSMFNLKLDVNGIWAGKDKTDGTIDSSGLVAYQNPTSMIDNVVNTGIKSLFISPGFQWVASPSIVISGEYRQPVYQKTNGIQQVTDHWYFLRASYRF